MKLVYAVAYYSGRPTQRARDGGDSPPFSSIFLALSFLCSQTLSTPVPPPVTQTVGRHSQLGSTSCQEILATKADPQPKKTELVIRCIARILSGMLVLFNGAYILLAILMITAAGEELFPKMTFSFLALGLLSIALLASWRWQTLGAFAIVAALLAYRMAERSRLGYEPKWSWFSTATVAIAMLFIVSSAIHWWIRRHSPKEPPSVEIR